MERFVWILVISSLYLTIATDFTILSTIYNKTNGAYWTPPWDENRINFICEDPGTGVICDGDLKITHLILNNRNMTGQIPTELGDLSQLSLLTLSHNHLTGTIPTELGNAAHLYYLDLHNNTNLGGELPTQLSNTNLSTIQVQDCSLSGTIPTTYSVLPLDTLNLLNNEFDPPYPIELCNNKIRYLLLRYNNFRCPLFNYGDPSCASEFSDYSDTYNDLLQCPPTPVPTVVPIPAPSSMPTALPTPTQTPISFPTPTSAPIPNIAPLPSPNPSNVPTDNPTSSPTLLPTPSPTPSPTMSPTLSPTLSPTSSPTPSPIPSTTPSPTLSPTSSPTMPPTQSLTPTPTVHPAPVSTPRPVPVITNAPTPLQTESPTESTSEIPTQTPTERDIVEIEEEEEEEQYEEGEQEQVEEEDTIDEAVAGEITCEFGEDGTLHVDVSGIFEGTQHENEDLPNTCEELVESIEAEQNQNANDDISNVIPSCGVNNNNNGVIFAHHIPHENRRDEENGEDATNNYNGDITYCVNLPVGSEIVSEIVDIDMSNGGNDGTVDKFLFELPYEVDPEIECEHEIEHDDTLSCEWIDTENFEFTSEGCIVVEQKRDSVTCQCTHLTAFVILQDITRYNDHCNSSKVLGHGIWVAYIIFYSLLLFVTCLQLRRIYAIDKKQLTTKSFIHLLIVVVCILNIAIAIAFYEYNPSKPIVFPVESMALIWAAMYVASFWLYCCVVYTWANVYHTGMSQSIPKRKKRIFVTCCGVVSIVILFMFISFSAQDYKTRKNLVLTGSSTLGIICMILAILYVMYGVLVVKQLRGVRNSVSGATNSDNYTPVIHRITKVTFLCFVFYIRQTCILLVSSTNQDLFFDNFTSLQSLYMIFDVGLLSMVIYLFYEVIRDKYRSSTAVAQRSRKKTRDGKESIEMTTRLSYV